MKTIHVHIKVKDLKESIKFYTALFSTEPSVRKNDYAKWMLEDPRINLAISDGHADTGIEHLGIQTESEGELKEVYKQMKNAQGEIFVEGGTTCCYSKSEKSWITDPQGVDWEVFYTHGEATVYGEGRNAKKSPEAMDSWSKQEPSGCNSSCGI